MNGTLFKGMRRTSTDWGALAAILAVLAFGWMHWTVAGWQWCLGLAAALSLLGWYTSRRRYQAIVNTPVSRIGSTSQGYARLEGAARPLGGEPLVSPFGTQCVWYHSVEDEVERTPQGTRTREIYNVESEHSFVLDDGSASCLIDPEGADLRPGDPSVSWYGDRRRTEWWIFPGQHIEALGDFATLRADRSPQAQRARVSDRLAEWKRDRETLVRQFDRDGNGEIDAEEWEQVRSAAERDVIREAIDTGSRDSANVLRKPRQGLYLVSTEDLDSYARTRQRWAWGYLLLVVVLLHAMWWINRRPQIVEDRIAHPVVFEQDAEDID
ncbi:EF-hand domain-containing protein [Chitiniphilus eburneus]|uniref:EF-hand domain-containing protein n=1 Tax=Chitiniphilus eburneus TaxID=2571148 RepID=A0A4U0PRQ6_9NEIS|nr:EF-hand domain-containing protein [Chitiniphilus eburneus]TJZ71056.1 hypothetical protein FAZ21_13915 [Chitiniphilus eburneus]